MGRTNSDTYFFGGLLDEVAVYPTALSARPHPGPLRDRARDRQRRLRSSASTLPRTAAWRRARRRRSAAPPAPWPGDAATVTVRVYAGNDALGTPVQTLSASRAGRAPTPSMHSSALAAGLYTAQAEQTTRRQHGAELGEHVLGRRAGALVGRGCWSAQATSPPAPRPATRRPARCSPASRMRSWPRSATTPTRRERRSSSPAATTRRGAARRTARGPRSAPTTTATSRTARSPATPATSPTSSRSSGRARATRAAPTTATTSAPGTSSSSTPPATTTRPAVARRARSSGCAPTWPRAPRTARSPTSTTRSSPRAPSTRASRACSGTGPPLRGRARDRSSTATTTSTSDSRRRTPNGAADPAYGIREFVVGTGGAEFYGFGTIAPNSEVRNTGTYGIIKLTLRPGSYDWEFVPVAGRDLHRFGSRPATAVREPPLPPPPPPLRHLRHRLRHLRHRRHHHRHHLRPSAARPPPPPRLRHPLHLHLHLHLRLPRRLRPTGMRCLLTIRSPTGASTSGRDDGGRRVMARATASYFGGVSPWHAGRVDE